MDKLKKCPFCGTNDIVKSCVPLDYPNQNVKAYINCNNCAAEISQSGNVKDSKSLLSNVVKMWNTRNGVDSEDDQCQLCHNALQCLVWAQDGLEAQCDNWGYFKHNYINGSKREILAAEMNELDK